MKNTGIYTLLGFIPLVSSFVLLPIYTQYLTAADYGIVSLAGVMESYLLVLITFGMQSAFSVYYFDYLNLNNGIARLLSTVLLSILGIGLIFVMIFLFGGEYIFNSLWENNLPFKKYGWYIYSNAVVLSLNQIIFQYYRVSENLKQVMFVSLAPFFGSTIGGIIGIVILKNGALGGVTGKAIGTLLMSIPFYLLLFKKIGVGFDAKIAKNIFNYAYPFVLIFFISNLSETADRFLMNQYFDLKIVGIYAFSLVVVSPIRILIQSYWNSVTPSMYKAVSENSIGKINIVHNGLSGVLIVSLTSIWGVIMVVDPVIRIVANPTYYGAIYYIPVLALTVFGRSYDLIYTFNASFYKMTKFLPLINVASLVVGVSSALILVGHIGIGAIFVAVVLSKITQGVSAYLIDKLLGYNSFPLQYQMPLVLLTFVMVILNYIVIYDHFGSNIEIVHFTEGVLFFLAFFLYNRDLFKKIVNHLN
ncbi:lipopolysaccharide biosynthesis protein [Rufibacter sp. LB8]|nr:oligosaccharide flippase family protein [Rufibacter sp. LB8]